MPMLQPETPSPSEGIVAGHEPKNPISIPVMSGRKRIEVRRPWDIWTIVTAILVWGSFDSAARADLLQFQHLGSRVAIRGNVLFQTTDGSVLLEGPDLQRYFIAPEERLGWDEQRQKVPLWSREQLRAGLRREFPRDFYVQLTNHYAVVYNCSSDFARHAGTLLERAYAQFHAHFGNRGAFRFERLPQPLIAVIFKTREEYLKATEEELGTTLAWSSGLYAQNTNRFYMFDAHGGELAPRRTQLALSPGRGSARQASTPLDPDGIETIIHEGTHQLAFNLGIHLRNAYTPTWFVEGLATYFEAADMDTAEGWQRAGELNPGRLAQFEKIYPQLPKGFVEVLVTRDELFRSDAHIADAYAMSWALTYYMMRAKPTGYVRYVRAIQERGLAPMGREERIEDFKKGFGTTPAGMEFAFRRYMIDVMLAAKRTRSKS